MRGLGWAYILIETEAVTYPSAGNWLASKSGWVNAKAALDTVHVEDESGEGNDAYSALTEIYAIMAVLRFIVSRRGNDSITLCYDCAYAADVVQGLVPSTVFLSTVSECQKLLFDVLRHRNVYWLHTKAHAGCKWNEMVDGCAKEAAFVSCVDVRDHDCLLNLGIMEIPPTVPAGDDDSPPYFRHRRRCRYECEPTSFRERVLG